MLFLNRNDLVRTSSSNKKKEALTLLIKVNALLLSIKYGKDNFPYILNLKSSYTEKNHL